MKFEVLIMIPAANRSRMVLIQKARALQSMATWTLEISCALLYAIKEPTKALNLRQRMDALGRQQIQIFVWRRRVL
jgi:hypothetical protein